MVRAPSQTDIAPVQLDYFLRDLVSYILLWAPYGPLADEDIFPRFGMTVVQCFDRLETYLFTHSSDVGLADRRRIDQACRLLREFAAGAGHRTESVPKNGRK